MSAMYVNIWQNDFKKTCQWKKVLVFHSKDIQNRSIFCREENLRLPAGEDCECLIKQEDLPFPIALHVETGNV